MLATVIGPIATAVIAFAVLRLTPAMGVRARTSFAMIKREFRPALAALGTFAVLAQLDIALARHYLPSKTAGLYSGAGLLARAPLYVSSAIALVAFPRFVALKEDEDQARRWLHLSLVSTVAICVPTSMAIVVLRRPIIDAVLGSQFVPAAVFVPILALAMTVMAAVSLLTYFHVAVETLAYRVLLGGLFLETGAIVLFHRSGSEIAAIVFLAGSASVALLYHAAHAALVRPSREQQPAPARNPILDLSIVLPCHNSGDTISELLAELLNQTAALGAYSFEIIVVSDGSSDDTVTRARAFEPTVRVIERARRQGKGSALRVGLSETLGRYIVYMDSDGDISPDALGPFLALMELYGPDIILGSKRHPMSVVSYPPLRRLMSWTYHHVTRVLFGVKVRDTQTGLKMIRREVLDAVLPRVLEKRYAFDLEFLVVARLLGFTRTFEAPITLSYRFTSGVNARQTLFIIIDTLAIAYRRYILGTYHRSGRAQGLDTSQQETTDQVVAEVLAQAETHVLP
jgi:hypothetical protein